MPTVNTAIDFSLLPFSVSRGAIWFFVGTIVFLFGLYTIVLLYHWYNYRLEQYPMRRLLSLYFMVSILLIGVMVFAAMEFTA